MTDRGRRGAIECPDCGTGNAPGTKFCESCGVSLAVRRRARDADTAREPEAARDRTHAEKQAVERELARARGLLKSIRLMFWMATAIAALSTLALLLAWDGLEIAGEEPAIYVLVSTTLTLLLAGGALFLHLHPLAWSLVLACLATLYTAVLLLTGQFGIATWIWAFVAFGMWGVMPILLKVHRLMQVHPDLIDARKLKRRGRREDVDVGTARLRAAERARQRSRERLRTFAVVAGVVVALLLGIFVIRALDGDDDALPRGIAGGSGRSAVALLPPEEVERIQSLLPGVLDDFRAAWARSDLDAVKAMFTDEQQVAFWPKVLGLLQKRGWEENLPALEEPDLYDRSQTERDVFFDLVERGTLKTRWLYADGNWRIRRFMFSGLR